MRLADGIALCTSEKIALEVAISDVEHMQLLESQDDAAGVELYGACWKPSSLGKRAWGGQK